MITIIHPTGIPEGEIGLPASKSMSNRALIINAISNNRISIRNLSTAADTMILNHLLNNDEEVMDCADGGTTMRFLLALMALQGRNKIITGSERLKQRPVKQLVEALNELGASIEYLENAGFLPLQVHPSCMHGGHVKVDATVSSQFISALMMIAPALDEGIIIDLQGLAVSAPYINMTAGMMAQAGAEVVLNESKIEVMPGNYRSCIIEIEPDWSAAGFFYEAVALSERGKIFLKNLSMKSLQGDAGIAELYSLLGVETQVTENGIFLSRKERSIQDFIFDFNQMPDAVPAVSMTCAGLGIKSKLIGLSTLRGKESDRISALQELIERSGGKVTTDQSGMQIHEQALKRTDDVFPVYNDHRMAMCLAPLSLLTGMIRLGGEDVVDKSFPGYWEQLKKLGFEVTLG
jgi:3-phosphoshikimate 1-carboxyvinyltransferase